MSSKPILTVAIPAYNVELYIEETVLSIAKSKYANNLEILIINDGSTDKTLEVSRCIEQKYPCVKVIDKKNGGHGSAINAGLKHATGKYFRLLDGDDWFDTEEFDRYITLLKNENTDLIFTDYVECFLKSNTNVPVTFYSNLPEYRTLSLDNLSFPEWGAMLPTTTIKTSLLQKFNFKIDENCFYVDQEYNLACYLCAKTAKYLPFMIYQYRLEREGQSMEKSSLIRNVASHQKVCERLIIEFEKHKKNMSPERQNYLKERVIIPMCHMQYMIAIEWCKSRKHFISFNNFLSNYPDFYQNPGIAGTLTNFHRKTHGFLIKFDSPIRKIADWKHNHPILANHEVSLKRRLFVFTSCLLLIAIVNIIVVNYVNSEHTFYSWDLSGYWKNSISLLDSFKQSKISGFQTIIDSMNTDYNYLPLVPMLPFLFIFGTSRLSFILIVLNLYIIPFALIMLRATSVAFKVSKQSLRFWVKPLLFAIFLSSPTILIPVINGRPDAICLIIIALIYYLIAKTKLHYISNYFILGFLTFLLILLRRYFSIWAVCLYAAIFITKTIVAFHRYRFSTTFIKKSLKTFLKLFTSGILVLICMFIASRSLLTRYITGGYNDVYSAYMLGSFLDQILLFVRYYGCLLLALVFAGIFVIYKYYRKTNISELTTICIIGSFLSFLLFTRIQTLGDQHMYMFAPFFTFCIAILIIKLSTTKLSIAAIISPIIVISLSLYSFIGVRSTNCSNLCYITGISEVIRPVVRNDTETILQIHKDLEAIMNTTDYLYILSSSYVFNDDLFYNSVLPNQPNINISGVKHVDKRDGFPNYFFDATYILIADPIQVHLADGGQEVISYLAEQILNGSATNLTLIQTYEIDDNITLKLFHKASPYDKIFLKETYNHFKNKYQNYPFLYESIRLEDK